LLSQVQINQAAISSYNVGTYMGTKAFVLLSGGIDSSTCLAIAIAAHGAENVTPVSVDYRQRHRRELHAAQDVCKHYGIGMQHQLFTIDDIPQSLLTDPTKEVPNVSYSELKGVSPSYVPFRNGQLLSKIAALAASRVAQPNEDHGDTGEIYIGTHAEDAAGDAYPDCRLDFIGAMGAAIYIGTYHKVRLRAPLIEMSKVQIIQEGAFLGVPYHLTWSCYKGEALHCGTCPTCRARKDGFRHANIADPTKYAA
jgi:7-cyano-7-deazaguanine synthase